MFERFKSSAQELKSVRNLCICAMLMALTLAISTLTIQIGDYIKIGFSFIASELAYLLFGPVVGMLFGGAADVFAYVLKPTGTFFPGFTISAVLGGLIYGLFWYKKPVGFMRIFTAKAVVALLINVLLGTYWLTILLGKGFDVLLPMRALKNVIMLPINSVLFYTVAKMIEKAKLVQPLNGVQNR